MAQAVYNGQLVFTVVFELDKTREPGLEVLNS